VVADPLEMPRDQHEFQRRRQYIGMPGHQLDQPPVDLVAERIETVVPFEHGLRGAMVVRHEGLQRVAEHRFGDVAHSRQQLLLRDSVGRKVSPRRFGDVGGQVADLLR
jgi:hypothetical protein